MIGLSGCALTTNNTKQCQVLGPGRCVPAGPSRGVKQTHCHAGHQASKTLLGRCPVKPLGYYSSAGLFRPSCALIQSKGCVRQGTACTGHVWVCPANPPPSLYPPTAAQRSTSCMGNSSSTFPATTSNPTQHARPLPLLPLLPPTCTHAAPASHSNCPARTHLDQPERRQTCRAAPQCHRLHVGRRDESPGEGLERGLQAGYGVTGERVGMGGESRLQHQVWEGGAASPGSTPTRASQRGSVERQAIAGGRRVSNPEPPPPHAR